MILKTRNEEAEWHQHSLEAMLADCFQGFGQMLHAALLVHFHDCQYEDSEKQYLPGNAQRSCVIHYPGLASTTIEKLMTSTKDCVDFVKSLYDASGRSHGSAYFYSYNLNRDLTPWKAIKGMQWKILLPVCLVRPLVKTFLRETVSKTLKDINRASMYYLDIPVISPSGDEYERLRDLLETYERNQGSRSVRPRIEPLASGETNLKFTPYDCCSFQGERVDSLESLWSIFRPLHELAKHAQAWLSNIV
mgnify:CR=1 FL=1